MPEGTVYSPYFNKDQDNMPKKVSSRLVKKQQKKLGQETLIAIAIAIVIGLLFIFVILPQVIRLFFKMIDEDNPFDANQDTIPPQAPILQAPVDATNSASLAVEGVAEAKSKVIFVLNGSQVDEVVVNDEGEFSYDLALETGDNNLSLYSVDEAGNESVQTKTYEISYDNEDPFLELETPEDGQEIELRKNQVIEIKGKTEPDSKVYINDRLAYPDSDGEFKSRYSLSEGENIIKFRIVDKAGNTLEQEIKVNFRF